MERPFLSLKMESLTSKLAHVHILDSYRRNSSIVEIEPNSSHRVLVARTRMQSVSQGLKLSATSKSWNLNGPPTLPQEPWWTRLPLSISSVSRAGAHLFRTFPFPEFHSLLSLSRLPTKCVRWRTRSNKLAAIALMTLFRSMFWIPTRTQKPSCILAIRPPEIASESPILESRRRRPRACRNQGQCRQRHHTQTNRYVTHPSQGKIRGEKRILGKHRNEPFSSCRIWGHDHSYKADCRLTHGSKWCDFRA